ncbi:MAG: hypothetical protein J3Q66DRAFT_376264 [Benniella sp.]|nr:MAG: hypothetical protein J3Q66DRAFT_376264 [Benniella sp.]
MATTATQPVDPSRKAQQISRGKHSRSLEATTVKLLGGENGGLLEATTATQPVDLSRQPQQIPRGNHSRSLGDQHGGLLNHSHTIGRSLTTSTADPSRQPERHNRGTTGGSLEISTLRTQSGVIDSLDAGRVSTTYKNFDDFALALIFENEEQLKEFKRIFGAQGRITINAMSPQEMLTCLSKLHLHTTTGHSYILNEPIPDVCENREQFQTRLSAAMAAAMAAAAPK